MTDPPSKLRQGANTRTAPASHGFVGRNRSTDGDRGQGHRGSVPARPPCSVAGGVDDFATVAGRKRLIDAEASSRSELVGGLGVAGQSDGQAGALVERPGVDRVLEEL